MLSDFTLYFDVEERRERRPGTEQNMSVGRTPGPGRQFSFMLMSISAWCGELRGEESGAAMESWESTELLSTERLLRCSSLRRPGS